MLIIPITGKFSKKNLPVMTIGIILTNCLVFFFFQTGDYGRYEKAMTYYFDSGLAKIEIRQYLQYVEESQSPAGNIFQPEPKKMKRKRIIHLHTTMEKDPVFMKKLLNDEIIMPDDAVYGEWRPLRSGYNRLKSKVIFIHYGFRPAYKNVATCFTYMFLHGGFMHLLGNMIFLWLVGCILELWCGRFFFIGMYFLTGILSAGLFTLMYPNSTAPLIGASGAISGLIGAFTVAYGRKKIRIFYSLGFYFNYAKVPAIILLPVWIGNELFMLFFGGVSQVAYVAHIGGLLSGALLGFLNLKVFRWINEEVIQDDPKEKIPALLDKAFKCLEKLDMSGARDYFEHVLEIDPSQTQALTNLFTIDKLNPRNETFHKTASRLLFHLGRDKDNADTLYQVYKEYLKITKRPKLSADLLFRLSSVFLAGNYPGESEKIIAALLKISPGQKKLPTALLHLAKRYLQTDKREKGIQCLKVLRHKYADSPESLIAQKILQSNRL